MAKIVLHQINNNDDQEIAKLCQALSENYKDVPFPFQNEDLKSSNKKFFWAYSDDQCIGCTGFILLTPQLAESIKTVIFNNARNKGYGAKLSQEIEDYLKSIGVKKVRSTIYANNHKMISIKLKQGYTIEGFHPDHEAPGWDEYSLGKVLH